MKIIIAVVGLAVAAIVLEQRVSVATLQTDLSGSPSPQYKWTQVAPVGSGTHQYEWKPGTYPSAIVPVSGFNDALWMIGQKKVWNSTDGIKWKDYDKVDWGERISTVSVFFRNKLWVMGGMDYASNTFLNEIWSSPDGTQWDLTVAHADWSPRKNQALIVFKDQLWLFGGETSVDRDKAPNVFVNDVWSSSDGIHWQQVLDQAPWKVRGSPRFIVFKEQLWLIGGQGKSDVWVSEDGKAWKQLSERSEWSDRYDYGLTTLDNFIWIYGGRESNPRNAYNDVWFSPDGVRWIRQTDEAPWTRRSGGFSTVFQNKLFLYGGKHTGSEDGFSGDIWTMARN